METGSSLDPFHSHTLAVNHTHTHTHKGGGSGRGGEEASGRPAGDAASHPATETCTGLDRPLIPGSEDEQDG